MQYIPRLLFALLAVLRVESTTKPYDVLHYYQQLLQYDRNSLAAHYGYVLALLRLNQPKHAIATLQPLFKARTLCNCNSSFRNS